MITPPSLFVVNVALPVLQRELNAGDAALQLIVGGYAFVYAAGLITAGRLGDRIGHRTVFLLGMGAFGLTSLWCGLAQSPLELVIARLVQGLAGAAMVPQVLALISLLFAPHERARALSVFGVVIGVGSVAGQVTPSRYYSRTASGSRHWARGCRSPRSASLSRSRRSSRGASWHGSARASSRSERAWLPSASWPSSSCLPAA